MTVTFASSRTVHSALKRALSPWFLANGWKRRAGNSCAFLRPAPSGYWCLWFQISAFGGHLRGSTFTLNLFPVADKDSPLTGGGAGSRVLKTLSEADRQLGFSIEEQLIAKIPDPPPSDPIYEWAQLPGYEGESWRETLANLRTVTFDTWKPGMDIWLRYYSVEDLDAWVEFLLPRLPHLLRQSADGVNPEG